MKQLFMAYLYQPCSEPMFEGTLDECIKKAEEIQQYEDMYWYCASRKCKECNTHIDDEEDEYYTEKCKTISSEDIYVDWSKRDVSWIIINKPEHKGVSDGK